MANRTQAIVSWRIYGTDGTDHGSWKGATKANALAALLRSVGHPGVRAVDGELVWPDEATRTACNAGKNWRVERREGFVRS